LTVRGLGLEIKKLTVYHRITSTKRRIFKTLNPQGSQVKEEGVCVEEKEDRVMPQKIRSDRLTVNGRKKKRY
jgi:hypothetical protein